MGSVSSHHFSPKAKNPPEGTSNDVCSSGLPPILWTPRIGLEGLKEVSYDEAEAIQEI